MSNSSIEQQIDNLSSKLNEQIEHQQREGKFATEANLRFEKNLLAFDKFFPDIAQAIISFKTREDFCLHVTKSGYGNFVPRGMSVPLYSDDPITQTKKQVKQQTTNAVFSLTDYTGYSNQAEDDRIHCRYMSKLGDFMVETRADQKTKLSSLPSSFPTGIIFGIGLGYHIPLLIEHTEFNYLFLIEPDFELFFASLFCTDWFSIIEEIDSRNACLFFHLGSDREHFIQDLERVADDIGAFSVVRSFLYQHTPDKEINELIQKWCTEYFRFQFGHGFYNDAVTGLAHSIHFVEKKVKFLKYKHNKKICQNTPIFIVGNGPSLDEAEQFIKENHEKAIVIAAGTAVASLYKKGVPVDFHVLVERPYSNYKIFGDILPAEEYKKINLLGLNTLYPDTVDRYKWSGIATKGSEAATFLLDLIAYKTEGVNLPLIPYSNPVVANTALSFSLFIGFKNVYLFGVDNGNLPCGSHHSKDSIYKQNQDDEEEEGFGCLKMDGKKIPGNLGGYVTTNELFSTAHSQLEKLISLFPDATVYNVGNGAKLKGAIPSDTDSLLPLNTNMSKAEQVEFLKSGSFDNLSVTNVDDTFIAVSRFNEICDHLTEICNTEVSSRKDAAEVLQRQSRYIYALRDSALNHLFHIIKGALLYYHCPMLTLIYSYKDERYTLVKYKALNKLWKGYIAEMREHYSLHFRTMCDLGKGT
jgi:hypothetical protein